MPVSIVIGGQFGSEGKGKVALEIATRMRAAAVIRVGGPNSGHTALRPNGEVCALRQLPASVLWPESVAVLPSGSLIDVDLFLEEVARLGLGPDRVRVSPRATLVTAQDQAAESRDRLPERIGSTGSGTGAALVRRIQRGSTAVLAADHPKLAPFLQDTNAYLRSLLDEDRRVVIEGTQGYGLSLTHGDYPKVTSRDVTAGTFVSEAGVSPLDVDDVTMVIRTFPIRVAGDSGDLYGETSWSAIALRAGLPDDYVELTTATRKIRRVGLFEPSLVRRAITMNAPTRIVLNHLDYVSGSVRDGEFDREAMDFLADVEAGIGRRVDWVGTGPATLRERGELPMGPSSQ